MKKLVFALLFLLPIFPAQQAFPQMPGYYPKGGPDIAADGVSLIQLIANPERYEMKTVRFIGYLHLEFEGNAVYLHREDFVRAISNDAIWINLPKDIKPEEVKAVNDQYVICTARFVASRHGHMGMFAGELENVTRLEAWPVDRSDGQELPPPSK